MKNLLFLTAISLTLSVAAPAMARDIGAGVSGSGSASVSTGGTSASVGTSANTGATASAGGGSANVGVTGSTLGSTASVGTGGLSANSTVRLSGQTSAQVSQLIGRPVFSSNHVNIGVVSGVTMQNGRAFLTVTPTASFAAKVNRSGLGAFQIAASATSSANGQLTIQRTDTSVMSSLQESATGKLSAQAK